MGIRKSLSKCHSSLTPFILRAGTGMPRAAERLISSVRRNSWNCTASTTQSTQWYSAWSAITSSMMRSGKRFLMAASTTSRMPVWRLNPPTNSADGSRDPPALPSEGSHAPQKRLWSISTLPPMDCSNHSNAPIFRTRNGSGQCNRLALPKAR